MSSGSRVPVLVWLALSAWSSIARADAIVVTSAMTASTIAEFFVDEQGVRVEIEVGSSDLGSFRNLLPDSVYEELGHPPQRLAERIPLFLQRDWVIRANERDPLSGRIVDVKIRRRLARDEITGQPLPVQPEDATRVLFVALDYSWQERPQSISIRPPLRDESDAPAANVGFVLYHDGLPVNDFRYLGAESTVDLDWNDPWFSRFRNKNLRRQYDAPLSVFLYVDFFEVRKEIVVRPRDLQQWVDLGLEGRQTIPVEDQAALKEKVAEFLAGRGAVTIDGRPATGTLDRIHFVRRSLRTTGVVDPPEPLDVNSATLGVIFVYPMDGLPQQATVQWDLFGPKIQSVPAMATDEAGGLPSSLTPDDPMLVWTNYLKNPSRPTMMTVARPRPRRIALPVISTICFASVIALFPVIVRRTKAGHGFWGWPVTAGMLCVVLGVIALPHARASLPRPFSSRQDIQPARAREILQALLYNVYRSFDHRDEVIVYDRLAHSISGDLLTDVYLQIRQSMELANQGGARMKIDNVETLDVAAAASSTEPALAWQCRWNASGSVGHWGHIHRRTNQYDAMIVIEPIDDAWKITALDVREQQRVDSAATR